jgi:hypothetical protein
MGRPFYVFALPAVLAMFVPYCGGPVRPAVQPAGAPPARLWQEPGPADLDLYNGPWGARRAPDPHGIYRFVELKHSGVNPGMTVRDREGRKWSVKQQRNPTLDESHVEVFMSRLLSAAGYHQPPVYYLASFTLDDAWGTRTIPGGRFRLHDKSLKDLGDWPWQLNPFVGTPPYQGPLAILMLCGASDLKNSNNTLYEHRAGDGKELWYVVRDLGSALGSTGRFAPVPDNPDAFERHRFVLSMDRGFVRFDYRGFHQELVRDRITAADLRWALDRLGALSDAQWADAFRAAGYSPDRAARYLRKIKSEMAEGAALCANSSPY